MTVELKAFLATMFPNISTDLTLNLGWSLVTINDSSCTMEHRLMAVSIVQDFMARLTESEIIQVVDKVKELLASDCDQSKLETQMP